MKTSESISTIAQALFDLQGEMKTIARSKVVKTGKYEFRYAPLDTIMETITPLMQKAGLVVLQSVDTDVLTTRMMHKSGEWIQSETHLNKDHANMQGFGGEITYKRRYALSALIGLVSDDDNDAPPVKRGIAIPAMAGIGDDLPDDWKIYLKDLADEVSSLVNAGKVPEAASRIDDAALEGDQPLFLWRQLDSKVRSAITNYKRPKV